jgi:hypothetical protein
MGQIYDGTRIVRIIGEDESSKLVKINDPMDPSSPDLSVGKYDVVVTSGASYSTRRVEGAQAMIEAIQVVPELMQVAGDLIVKAQDWPGAEELAERLQKTIPPQLLSEKERAEAGNQPNMQAIMAQQAQQQQQMQKMGEMLQKLEKENLLLKTKDAADAAKHQIDMYKAETDRLTAYANIFKADQEFNLRQLETEADDALELIGHMHEASENQLDRDSAAEQAAEAAEARASSSQTTSTPSSE